MKSDGSSQKVLEDEERELESEVQMLTTFSPTYTCNAITHTGI